MRTHPESNSQDEPGCGNGRLPPADKYEPLDVSFPPSERTPAQRQGPGSWEVNVLVKLSRPGRAHGGARHQRWDYDGDEDGMVRYKRSCWGCGNFICGVCATIDAVRERGWTLCGWTAPDGSRCVLKAGHPSPGDGPMFPADIPDHRTLAPRHIKLVAEVLGRDPFQEVPA